MVRGAGVLALYTARFERILLFGLGGVPAVTAGTTSAATDRECGYGRRRSLPVETRVSCCGGDVACVQASCRVGGGAPALVFRYAAQALSMRTVSRPVWDTETRRQVGNITKP